MHIYDEEEKLSPSAFIPFCNFGGNMSATSRMEENFGLHVCEIFRAKILNDQLCYEVDLEELKSRDNFAKDLKLGLEFFMDYNEDRQVILEKNVEYSLQNVGTTFDQPADDKNAIIYLNTIGKTL